MKQPSSILAWSLGAAALAAASPQPARATVRVVSTIPDFAGIAREVGGERVLATSLVRPTQDPHFVDARPSFAVDLSEADLLIYAGADLEAGWLPPLVRTASNPGILPGESGNLDVSTLVPLKEVPPASTDRSGGDVHPVGNPHTWLDPRNGLRIAIEVTRRLKALDPDGSGTYEANLRDFARRLGEKMNEWKAALAPLAGARVIVYHGSWIYFLDWAGFVQVATIEPLPGVQPSDSETATLVAAQKSAGARLVLAESFYPSDRARFVADGTGAALVSLPVMAGATPECATYVDLIDAIVRGVTAALGTAP